MTAPDLPWSTWFDGLIFDKGAHGRIYIHPDRLLAMDSQRVGVEVEPDVIVYRRPGNVEYRSRLLHLNKAIPVEAMWVGPMFPGEHLDLTAHDVEKGWVWPHPFQAHDWESYEFDGGPLGLMDFWRCKGCGAGGGPWWGPNTRPSMCFHEGPQTRLPEDCGLSKAIIAHHTTV